MHTVFVFGSLFVFFPGITIGIFAGSGEILEGVVVGAIVIISIGMLGEAIVAGIITPVVGKATMFVAKRFRSGDREEEKE
jgi:hypothetical protein